MEAYDQEEEGDMDGEQTLAELQAEMRKRAKDLATLFADFSAEVDAEVKKAEDEKARQRRKLRMLEEIADPEAAAKKAAPRPSLVPSAMTTFGDGYRVPGMATMGMGPLGGLGRAALPPIGGGGPAAPAPVMKIDVGNLKLNALDAF